SASGPGTCASPRSPRDHTSRPAAVPRNGGTRGRIERTTRRTRAAGHHRGTVRPWDRGGAAATHNGSYDSCLAKKVVGPLRNQGANGADKAFELGGFPWGDSAP